MRPLIGTSWKMNLTATEAAGWLDAFVPLVEHLTDRDLFVLPAFPAIFAAQARLTGTTVGWGAQDVHPEDAGAHTGDVCAEMLRDLGCTYVEVGHAERRRDHGETPAVINAKVAAVFRWGMTPILCVGEAWPAGPEAAVEVVLGDLEACLAGTTADQLGRTIVAYEPAWAIGEGARAATPSEIGIVHRGVHAWLCDRAGGRGARVIYGGSVDEDVAPRILAEPGVDGLFVGRRALDPRHFARIASTCIDAD